MSLGKKYIVKNISTKALISSTVSAKFLEHFLKIIKSNTKHTEVKISSFGTFYYHESPKRVGRNPKTKEEFLIPKINKLAFKSSNLIKSFLN